MTELLALNNGATTPRIGFGVFQSAAEITAEAVRTALQAGYRHIDTATGKLDFDIIDALDAGTHGGPGPDGTAVLDRFERVIPEA